VAKPAGTVTDTVEQPTLAPWQAELVAYVTREPTAEEIHQREQQIYAMNRSEDVDLAPMAEALKHALAHPRRRPFVNLAHYAAYLRARAKLVPVVQFPARSEPGQPRSRGSRTARGARAPDLLAGGDAPPPPELIVIPPEVFRLAVERALGGRP
jgi:hypothetical protein